MNNHFVFGCFLVTIFFQTVTCASLDIEERKKQFCVLNFEGAASRPCQGIMLNNIAKQVGDNLLKKFDLVAGISAGAGLAVYLTATNPDGSNIYTPEELTEAIPNLIKASAVTSWYHKLTTLWGLIGPRYSNASFREISKKDLGDSRLSQTSIPIIVPVIDFHTKKIVILSTLKARENPEHDCFLRDVVGGAVAIPAIAPPYRIRFFQKDGSPGGKSMLATDAALYFYSPAVFALQEAKKLCFDGNIRMLDVGSGALENWFIDPVIPNATKEPRIPQQGLLQVLPSLASTILRGLMFSSDECIKAFFGGKLNSHYFCLQVLLKKKKGHKNPYILDDFDPRVHKDLRLQTEEYMQTEEYKQTLRNFFGPDLLKNAQSQIRAKL